MGAEKTPPAAVEARHSLVKSIDTKCCLCCPERKGGHDSDANTPWVQTNNIHLRLWLHYFTLWIFFFFAEGWAKVNVFIYFLSSEIVEILQSEVIKRKWMEYCEQINSHLPYWLFLRVVYSWHIEPESSILVCQILYVGRQTSGLHPFLITYCTETSSPRISGRTTLIFQMDS